MLKSNHRIILTTLFLYVFSVLAVQSALEAGAETFVGGSRGIIADCYATGDVAGDEAVGGLAGGSTGDISNSFAAGNVTGEDKLSGLVGRTFWFGGAIENCYYDKSTTGRDDTDSGMPKATDKMMRKDTFDGWDFDNTWAIEEGESYPYLQFED